MAHLLRLICVMLVFAAAHAHAFVPMVSSFVGRTTPLTYGASRDQVCTAGSSVLVAVWSSDYDVQSAVVGSNGNCDVVGKNRVSGQVYRGGFQIDVTSACPNHSTLTGGSCTCNAGYVEGVGADAGKCVPTDPCKVLQGVLGPSGLNGVNWWSETRGPWYGCVGGSGANAMCQTVAHCTLSEPGPGGFGHDCAGLEFATGARVSSCAATNDAKTPETPKPSPPPAPCPIGQAPGEVNGVTSCYPRGNDKPLTTDAPGNGSNKVKNPDGSTTQTSQTGTSTASGGQVTTSTTTTTTTIKAPGDSSDCKPGETVGTTTKDGQSVKTCTGTSASTSTGSQQGFCKDNQTSKLCGDGQGGSFGGNCAAGFKAVSDDAVLNAMAEEQYRRNCHFFEKKPDATEESSAYGDMKAKGKQGGDQTGDLPAGSKKDISIGPGDIDASNALGAAACITDRTIVVMGQSIKLPLSQLCVWLGYMGTVLLACSYLVAARIVLGGK